MEREKYGHFLIQQPETNLAVVQEASLTENVCHQVGASVGKIPGMGPVGSPAYHIPEGLKEASCSFELKEFEVVNPCPELQSAI
jgi:hypothetical protein